MFGIALEGGGAKGAFHIGALKALLEHGYEFEGITGTSIGAFNGALLCQGDFEKAYELWTNMEPSSLFDIDDEYMKKLTNNKSLTPDVVKYLAVKAREAFEHRGIDTEKLKNILNEYIDEKRIRESKVDFGVVTLSLPDFKGVEIYKEDIQEGKLHDYIMASANYPGFKKHSIDGKVYVDGGLHDNCPINLLIRKGYTDIIAVRTSSNIKYINLNNPDVNIINIVPSEDLGSTFIFDNNLLRKNIKLGYYDALKVIKGLKGSRYYVEGSEEQKFMEYLISIPEEIIFEVGKVLEVGNIDSRRMLFEKILPTIADLLKLPKSSSYEDICIGLLESVALKRGIEKYRIYTLQSFIKEIKDNELVDDTSKSKISHLDNLKKLAYDIVGWSMLDDIGCVLMDLIEE